jgi:hypothetical protein
MISKSYTQFGKLKFYSQKVDWGDSTIKKVYADIDSNGTRIFYSFYPDMVIKTEEVAKQVGYRLLFDKLPLNHDSVHFQQLSSLDTLVFSKATTLFSMLGYSYLKKLDGAIGFSVEIYYIHGFPKNKKFQPM